MAQKLSPKGRLAIPAMTNPNDTIRHWLKELERSFTAFDRGDRSRLFESRDSLTALSEAVEQGPSELLGPICEIASRLLGVLLMEGGLTEARSVQVVRELLSFIEAQVMHSSDDGGLEGPGGVFHVVNSERVGDLLVRKGLIAHDQLEKALLLQRVSKGKRVGQVLVAMNAIDQRTLENVLDTQKADTRRAETLRGAGAVPGAGSATPSLKLEPLPPLPGAPGGLSMPPSPAEPGASTAAELGAQNPPLPPPNY